MIYAMQRGKYTETLTETFNKMINKLDKVLVFFQFFHF